MLSGISIYTKEGIRTVIPMDDDHRVWTFVCILIFVAIITVVGWQWHSSSRHLIHLEQHRLAVEACINSVETDLARVDCLRSNKAISSVVSITQ